MVIRTIWSASLVLGLFACSAPAHDDVDATNQPTPKVGPMSNAGSDAAPTPDSFDSVDTGARDVATVLPASTEFAQVAVGPGYACSIAQGALWCWGGVFGPSPRQLPNALDWIGVSIDESSLCGITADRTMWCRNAFNPEQMSFNETSRGPFVSFDSEGGHWCGLRDDRSLHCKGNTPASRVEPGPATWRDIAVGREQICGIHEDDGSLWCWGTYFPDGRSRPETLDEPTLIDAGPFEEADANEGRVYAIREGGELVGWSWPHPGAEPFRNLLEGERVHGIHVGRTVCAIRNSDDALLCWGDSSYGQLGTRDLRPLDPPVVQMLEGVAEVATGNAVCARTNDGQIWCWGSNALGELGQGYMAYKFEPTQVPGTETWSAVAGGAYHYCGMTNAGVKCWGNDDYGQLGTTAPEAVPSPVETSTPVTSIRTMTASQRFTCAVEGATAGHLTCWGNSLVFGQSGSPAPVPIGTDTDWTWIGSGAEGRHTCGIRAGELYCIGLNAHGQLGDGTTDEATSFVRIGLENDWTRVDTASGIGAHTCGIRADNSLWCWGEARYGAVGVGTEQADVLTPMQVGSDTDWKHLSLGVNHTCAVKQDGTAWCWGQRPGLTDSNRVPDREPYLVGSDFGTLDTSRTHTCGVKTDDTLWCWGGTVNTPTQVGMDTDWVGVAVAWEGSSCAFKRSGTLWCWGEGGAGQGGHGHAWSTEPVAVELPE